LTTSDGITLLNDEGATMKGATMKAPIAQQIPFEWQRPTGAVTDPWAWLRDRENPATIEYLNDENAYAERWFEPHHGVIETVFGEIKSRVQETDLAAPVFKDGWWYAARTEEGQSYAIHCRGRSRETASGTVLLDENSEAADAEYFSLNAFEISHDGGFLAWSSDRDGSERYTLRIRDLTTGTDLDDCLTDTTWGGCAWSSDGSTLFYVKPDTAMRPYQVWRHVIGTRQDADTLVFEDTDERFFVGVDATRSGDWIVIGAESKQSSECWLIPADTPLAAPQLVRGREDDLEYHIDHWGDRFVVLTNLEAEDFRVMTAPLDNPGRWTELVAHQSGRRIVAAEPFADHLIIHEWENAQQRLRVLFDNGDDQSERVIDLGAEPHELELDSNPMYATSTVRFSYQSFTRPTCVFEEDVQSGVRTLLKETPVPGVDLSRYTAERQWATAPDGTLVPVDIVHLVDATPNSVAPCSVYGYGSYESSMPPWFSVARLSLLDRGWTFALVHPRGGGELGRRWHLEGKMLNKKNTFSDTIACCEHLLSSGWAAPGRLAVRGGSAGGLLVGACINMRPELFAAAVAQVPFVDVVSTMSDPSLPLTITEWEEWGDPRSEPAASYMLSYSPYDNVAAVAYPALFVTAGLNDPRVSYHEPAKWVAKLRAVGTGDQPLVFTCEMGAGHGGPSGRYDSWREEARTIAFLLASV
jgi:oligopeptidase B